jgi:hypothetical protein
MVTPLDGMGPWMGDEPTRLSTTGEVTASLGTVVGPGEEIVDHVTGLGATLVVTSSRVIVVRQGAHFRPRNGIRSWPHGELREVSLSPPRRGHGRILLRDSDASGAVSVFVDAEHWSDAERVVGDLHALARARTRARDRTGGSAETATQTDLGLTDV